MSDFWNLALVSLAMACIVVAVSVVGVLLCWLEFPPIAITLYLFAGSGIVGYTMYEKVGRKL